MRIYGHVVADGNVVPVQQSPASALVDLEYLLGMEEVRALADPMILYCGAVPTLDSARETVGKLGLPEATTSGVGEAFLARLHDADHAKRLRYLIVRMRTVVIVDTPHGSTDYKLVAIARRLNCDSLVSADNAFKKLKGFIVFVPEDLPGQ